MVRPIQVEERPVALRVPIDGGFLVTRGEDHRLITDEGVGLVGASIAR
jgi:hypothetical protein